MIKGIILSGGMDSSALAWWKKPDIAFTLNYGQKAANAEIIASAQLCKTLNIKHIIINIDCSSLGSGDMAGTAPDINAPATDWWPFRNQMLITLIGMKAISHGVNELLIGTVKSDCIHIDGTKDFIKNISNLMAMQEGGIKIEAPAINMTTLELIRKSEIPHDQLCWAHSCHVSNIPCGHCRGCNKYAEVMRTLDFID